MQAVFLIFSKEKKNKKKFEPCDARLLYDAMEKNPTLQGIREPIGAVHTICIPNYMKLPGGDSPILAFRPDSGETITPMQGQIYTFLEKQIGDERYYLPYGFSVFCPGSADFYLLVNGEEKKVRVEIAAEMGQDSYEQIIRELTDISIRLIYLSDGKDKRMKQEYLSKYELEIRQMDHQVKELMEMLKSLSKDPMSDVTSQPALRPFRQVKHLNTNVIMDHYVLQKPRVRTSVHTKTFDIYENRKIYGFLELLEQRLDRIQREIQNESEQQVSTVRGEQKSLEELRNTVGALSSQLQQLKKTEMFRHCRNDKRGKQKLYPLRSTNLFVNHPKYRQAFHLMSNYKDMAELMEYQIPYLTYEKVSQLYEVWCYFKILEIFMTEYGYQIDRITKPKKKTRYGRIYFDYQKDKKEQMAFEFETYTASSSREIAHFVGDYIQNVMKMQGEVELQPEAALWDLVIHLTNGKDDVYLGYNCTFLGKRLSKTDQNGRTYDSYDVRPDIFLLLNHEVFFTCDAKYKNYKTSFQGVRAWYEDIFECAAYKYMYRLKLHEELHEASDKEKAESQTRATYVAAVGERFCREIQDGNWPAEKPVAHLKNGGCCILNPAITDEQEYQPVAYYNGKSVRKLYEDYLTEAENNSSWNSANELTEMQRQELYEDILQHEKEGAKYEYHLASTRFLPGDDRGFKKLFYEALTYGADHFLVPV